MSAAAWRPLWPDLEPILREANGGRLPAPNANGWVGPIRSPLREDDNPSFSVKQDSETDPGAWTDHATGESGSIAELTDRLGLDPRRSRVQERREPLTVEMFARERQLDVKRLRKVWQVMEGTKGGRPGLVYPTRVGVPRIKFVDGALPKYAWMRSGGRAHWYGLGTARKIGGATLFLVNGEPSVWAASQAGVPAVCSCAGESVVPSSEMIAELNGMGFSRFAVVYDLDGPGRDGARRVAAALRAEGVEAVALELPADLGAGGDVDDLHRRVGSELRQALQALPELAAPADVEVGSTARPELEPRSGPSWPQPLAPEALYGPAGEFVRLVEPHTEADPAALLVQFLVAAGSCIGAGPAFRLGGDSHPARLFSVLVGDTARGRKGTSWGWVKRVFAGVEAGWDKEHVASGLSSGEGLIWAVRDPTTKPRSSRKADSPGDPGIDIVDPGVGDKRLLVVEGEFASVLKVAEREGNTISAVLRLAWDTGNLRVMTKNNPAVATGAHVSVIGHITAEELRRRLTATEVANGLANRFLWVCVRRSKLLPDGGSLQAADLTHFVDDLGRRVGAARGVLDLRRTPSASDAWRQLYPELTRDVPGLLGAVIARAEAQVLRLAVTYALLDASRWIDLPHLKAAVAVWQYCEDSARFIFGDAFGDPVADEILSALRAARAGLSRTEIRDLFSKHQKGARIIAALTALQRQGLVQVTTENTGGRPAERWLATVPRRDRSDEGDRTAGSLVGSVAIDASVAAALVGGGDER